MTLADRIRTARKAAGLSQVDAAERADMSRSQWWQLEHGQPADPQASTLRRVADALETTTDALTTDVPDLDGLTDTDFDEALRWHARRLLREYLAWLRAGGVETPHAGEAERHERRLGVLLRAVHDDVSEWETLWEGSLRAK